MASFTYAGQLNSSEAPVTIDVVIKNSAHVAVGEAVTLDAGVDSADGIGDRILGVCVGIYDVNGLALDNADTSQLDGTWVSATQTYTAGADNVTDDYVTAKVIVDKMSLFRNDADADLTKAMVASHFHIVSATQIDGDTNAQDKGQFWLAKLDPEDASVGFFCISESVMDPYVQIT